MQRCSGTVAPSAHPPGRALPPAPHCHRAQRAASPFRDTTHVPTVAAPTPAIGPEAERDQDHQLLACALCALPLPFVCFPGLVRLLDGDPVARSSKPTLPAGPHSHPGAGETQCCATRQVPTSHGYPCQLRLRSYVKV